MSYMIISNDYAHVPFRGEAGYGSLYYGYEVTALGKDGEDGEWCFQVKAPGLEVTIPYSELVVASRRPRSLSQFEVVECLLAGIQECFRRGIFRAAPEAPTP